jgi:hypothetical protein
MLIPQLFEILLDRPKELAEAQMAARADDNALVARYVFEASRYFPLTPGLFRNCEEEYKLASGTWRAKTIPKGAFVMAATRSAMQGNRLNRDEMPHCQDSCLRPGPRQWSQSGKLLTSPPFFA